MKSIIAKSFGVLLLLMTLTVTSCNKAAQLKVQIEIANKSCPIQLDDNMGTVTSIEADGNDVVYHLELSENSALTMEQLRTMPNTNKNCILAQLASDSETLGLLNDVVSIEGGIVYSIKKGSESYDLEMNTEEIQASIEKTKKLRLNIYPKEDMFIALAVSADMNEMAKIIENNLKNKEATNDCKCFVEDKNFIITSTVESISFEQINASKDEVKNNIMKNVKQNSDPTYEACAIQGYNIVYRYTTDSGESFDITLTPKELKERLQF